jgi:very-short-patch-repair endonuclease
MGDRLMAHDIPEQVSAAADYAANAFKDDLLSELVDEDHGTESPIEEIFLVWFKAHQRATTHSEPFVESLRLIPQVDVEAGGHKYRLDFVVGTWDADLFFDAGKHGLPTYAIAVELDGHDFHEKTKAQVALRNRRDRDLQIAGWRVFHFSGSEVTREPLKCVLEVVRYAARCHQRLWSAVFDKKQTTATAATDAQ